MKSDLTSTLSGPDSAIREVSVLINRPVVRILALAVAFAASLAGIALAQNPNCGVVQADATTMLPTYSGTLPPLGDMSLGGGSSYVYVVTQWGFARASLA